MTSVCSIGYQAVVEALREARITDHIAQEELDKVPGGPQSFIAKVKNGERRLDIVGFVHLCQLVGIDPISIIDKL